MQNKIKSEPIICGIDIGAWTLKIAAYDGEKFEILTNQANFRETPSLVAFTPSERMIGQSANSKLKSNFANTVRSPMRLIGLGKNPHFIEQELKYSTVNYDLQESIQFLVKQSNQQLKMQPQQLLIALMSKVKQIVSQHNFHIHASYIAVPSYLSNSQRQSVRKCAQVIKLGQVHLVDDWVAISSQYSYFRIKELQALQTERNVIFIDVGYSKFSIYAVQFSQNKCSLIDYQHLKYTGSKNMDNYLIQFYDDLFYKKTNEHKIVTNSKALIKLKDMVEKQRKVLSANSEHHMSIQYIMNEEDLSYNMNREQFENIIMPALSQMASALNNIKSRVQPKVPIHSVELIGGASRIPLIQQIVSDTFGIEASRTLNSSEAMTRGATIYGSIQNGFVSVPYQVSTQNFAAVSVAWSSSKNDIFLGENQKNYSNKKIIFDFGCKYPCENVLNFGNEGVVELYVYYEHQIASQSIGYLRVNTPNKVILYFDGDKIISAKCIVGGFLIYNFHEIKEQKWIKMQKIQRQLQQNDKRITTIYNMKNQYESLIYKSRDKICNQWQKVSSKAEQTNILALLKESEKWIEMENEKPNHNESDVKQYTQRIDSLNTILEMMRRRLKVYEGVEPQYRQFMDKAKSKQVSSSQSRVQLQKIVKEVELKYRNMVQNLFQTEDLNQNDIRDAMRRISRLF